MLTDNSFSEIATIVGKRPGINSEVGVDPLSIAGIVLAIIGTAITAGAAAESVVQRELNGAAGSGTSIAGAFWNRTQWGWSPMNDCNKPYHGDWGIPPKEVKRGTGMGGESVALYEFEPTNEYNTHEASGDLRRWRRLHI